MWLGLRALKRPPTPSTQNNSSVEVIIHEARDSRVEAPSHKGLPPSVPPRLTIYTSPLKLNPLLGLNTLIFEGVFDDFHFGDCVGKVDKLLRGIAPGDDGVLHFWAGL